MTGRGANGPIWRGKRAASRCAMIALAGLAAISVLAGGLPGALSPAHPAVAAEPAAEFEPAEPVSAVRRLSEAQYKQSIADIFGDRIKVPGRFEPPLRKAGLLAVGDSEADYSASGLEQNELRARDIASQVLSDENRAAYLKCGPDAVETFDEDCARVFFGEYGRLIYRRPLTRAEIASAVNLSSAAMPITGNFHESLQEGLARLLYSPNFVFRIELSEPDPARPGSRRLDAYSLASRLSFLLWNAPPDDELLRLAESGRLHQPEELAKQADRLIASPRFRTGVRALFSDMLGFERFERLSKDQGMFPIFTSQLAADAREQVLRTIELALFDRDSDYRDIFTTRDTFINRNLGALYRIPIVDGAGVDGWAPYTFDERESRSGILTLAGILMLDPSHEGRSSPTVRGKLIREALLCQPVPDPPPDVDFTAVQDIDSKIHRTARDRLNIHMESPVCAACHALTDPIGLALENYDTIGAYRTQENEKTIDASGVFEGKPYADAIGLGEVLRENPAAPMCLVQRSFEYGTGREASGSEYALLDSMNEQFAADGYRIAELLRRIAASAAFRSI